VAPLIAVAIMAAALAACAVPHARHAKPAGAPHSTSAAATQLKTYTPYAATGTVVVPVAANHVSGSCWTTSISVPKAGVYRCLIGNAIGDPCFASTVKNGARSEPTVLCAVDPWTPATLVTLTQPMPQQLGGNRSTAPWALELANGARCVAVTGTVPLIGAIPLEYSCGGGAGAGRLTTVAALMSVQYAASPDGPLQTVDVTTAWSA
jgi:hypothetical protein